MNSSTTSNNTLPVAKAVNIPKMKIVKNPSLFQQQCTFTIYRPRVYNLSQWWSQHKKESGCTSWSIHSIASFWCLKEIISGETQVSFHIVHFQGEFSTHIYLQTFSFHLFLGSNVMISTVGKTHLKMLENLWISEPSLGILQKNTA